MLRKTSRKMHRPRLDISCLQMRMFDPVRKTIKEQPIRRTDLQCEDCIITWADHVPRTHIQHSPTIHFHPPYLMLRRMNRCRRPVRVHPGSFFTLSSVVNIVNLLQILSAHSRLVLFGKPESPPWIKECYEREKLTSRRCGWYVSTVELHSCCKTQQISPLLKSNQAL